MDVFDFIDPQALLILVIMVIGALRWIMENMKKNRAAEQDEDEDGMTFEDLYEEARREIAERQRSLDDWNEPAPDTIAESEPPPPPFVRPETAPPPMPEAPPPLPAKRFIPPPPKPTPAPAPAPGFRPPTPPKRPTLSAAEQRALERVQAVGIGTRRSRRLPHRSRVRQLLATPSSARDAIVLREILGPPKGMGQ